MFKENTQIDYTDALELDGKQDLLNLIDDLVGRIRSLKCTMRTVVELAGSPVMDIHEIKRFLNRALATELPTPPEGYQWIVSVKNNWETSHLIKVGKDISKARTACKGHAPGRMPYDFRQYPHTEPCFDCLHATRSR